MGRQDGYMQKKMPNGRQRHRNKQNLRIGVCTGKTSSIFTWFGSIWIPHISQTENEFERIQFFLQQRHYGSNRKLDSRPRKIIFWRTWRQYTTSLKRILQRLCWVITKVWSKNLRLTTYQYPLVRLHECYQSIWWNKKATDCQ